MSGPPGSRSGVFSEELLKSLECPVCLKFMTGPIHNCVTGHSICSQCKQQDVKQCPVCTAEFSCARNFVAEEMARHILFPCENKDHGCSMTMLSSEFEQHHVTCSYRIYKCPMDCKWTGRRGELKKHYTDAHPKCILECDSVEWKWGGSFNELKYYYLICAYGELFFWFGYIDPNERYLTSCVHYIGEAEKAKMFKYTVTFKSNDGRRSLSYTDTTKNDSSDLDTITKSKELFLVNGGVYKLFTGKDGKAVLDTKISRI